jgi:TetR/AcrR family transcriptional repressor of nem operon
MRYEKGRKDASRQRIMEVAADRFRDEGIAASGLAGIMSEAGLTNGAFYPHFKSKAELVRETVGAALDAQTKQAQEMLAGGGLAQAIAVYLSGKHRDNPAKGCAFAALLPELARQPRDTRRLVAERLSEATDQISAALPSDTQDPEATALALQALLIGSLQLARAVQGTPLSDRILAAGAAAAKTLIGAGK